MILGFIVSHLGLLIILGGFIMPRYYAVFIPPHRQSEGTETTITYETKHIESTLASDEDDMASKAEAGNSNQPKADSGHS